MLDYPEQVAWTMLSNCKKYLERLIRRVDPAYECIAYRAGAWCLAPSPYMIRLLVELGIRLDLSIVGHLRYNTKHVKLDYTHCEESFRPFFPEDEDARKVSAICQPIVCVPTYVFEQPINLTIMRDAMRLFGAAGRNSIARRIRGSGAGTFAKTYASGLDDWSALDDPQTRSALPRAVDKIWRRYTKRLYYISDLSLIDYYQMKSMIRAIRRRMRKEFGLLPFVLASHTKNFQDFSDLTRFLTELSRADDIEFITLTQLSARLSQGSYPVRTRSGFIRLGSSAAVAAA